jgi:hypothetical protein
MRTELSERDQARQAARGGAAWGGTTWRESRPRQAPEPVQGRAAGVGTMTRPPAVAEPRRRREAPAMAEPRVKTQPRTRPQPRLRPEPRTGSGRPAGRSDRPRPDAWARRPGGRGLGGSRTPFVLLVLGLLGGGLICLLVINTTLATASFRVSNLQQSNASLAQQEQVLQQQIAREESPATIERRAYRLGMRQQQHLNFLNAATGRLELAPKTLPADVPIVPGFTP